MIEKLQALAPEARRGWLAKIEAAGNDETQAKQVLDEILDNPELRTANGQLHHIATNKNWISAFRGGPWSPKFAKLFESAGMTLEDAANIVRIEGHVGPHTQAYHEYILLALESSLEDIAGISARKVALTAGLETLGREACTPGSELFNLLRN